MGKTEKTGTAPEQEAQVQVHFVAGKFVYQGKEYISAELEAAAEAGDQAALDLIQELISIGAGVLVVEHI